MSDSTQVVTNLPLEGGSKFAERKATANFGRGSLGRLVDNPLPKSASLHSPISISPQRGGSKLARTLREPSEIIAAGLAEAEKLAALEEVAARYAVAVTPAMAELIDPAGRGATSGKSMPRTRSGVGTGFPSDIASNNDDPIARQFVPDATELTTTPEELADPIGDGAHEAVEGLIHRYPDRVLLKFTSVCAVYCRFCFRREMVGQEGAGMLPDEALGRALDYIQAHPEIWEVIVSGGDPLVASPRRIARLMQSLSDIDHAKIVRFHTRVPVVAPERVTDELVAALKSSGKTVWIAIHANHPRELTENARAALARLVDAGIPLVSQTVLLRGVNDDADTLGALMRAFVETRIKPYYLHHGDLAPGTSHFRTTIGEGQGIMKALRGRYSGLCQPVYVLDIPGGHGKVPIGPGYLCETEEGWTVEGISGARHAYRDAP